MKNVNMSIKGDALTITVNLKETGTLSKSGNSEVIATTKGNVSVPGRPDVKIGLNIYQPVRARAEAPKSGKSLKVA
jgi:hypothetical protein